ncbi:ceramide transfer protein [Patella vulgata]|uniref:ceramide transfer protein n=1 Tax=Patella vulgata TaxID=6465 RepID=UPI00217FDBA1|nr:ceramide transfer protein [Patella vulgata]
MMSEERDILCFTDDEDELEEEPSAQELQGTISKWTNYLHGWQDRFIVLKDSTLSYYKSEDETAFGCRGAVSLSKATVTPHQFDECRFDVCVGDSVWYLRATNPEERQHWIDDIEIHRQAESGYGSENNLRRHGSMLSLASGTSLSTTSASSFKRGRGLREKLHEMETFRDILCRQIDTLQSYFDSCASAVAHGTHQQLNDNDDIDDIDDLEPNSTSLTDNLSHKFEGLKTGDIACILQQHGGHSVDFKGEAFTFKATTAGIVATLSHCIELMSQREEAWKKRLEKEVDKRKKYEESYKSLLNERPKAVVLGGPDYEEGPHCLIPEEEFYDAVDATLDKLEKEEESKRTVAFVEKPPKISLSPEHKYYAEVNKIVTHHLGQINENLEESWTCIAEEGELKVYKRELEEDGIVIDPLKAIHVVKGITGHEVCKYFWDIDFRMEWEATLDSSEVIEWLSEDTFVSHNVIKRVWPASQRDALFWSHIQHIASDQDEEPDRWIVVNYSTEHEHCPSSKYVRVFMNVAMVCETMIKPPADGKISRDDITCKIIYTAEVNPGGWAPASVLRAVYKREYPKFLKRFTSYVKTKTENVEILL